jgi:hypothetical protein
MSVSIGEGLRMMQGGVDRTGFAEMADAIGNPGLDLVRQRREEARLQALLNSAMQIDDDEGGSTDMSGLPTSGPSGIDEATGKFESGQTFSENLAQGISDKFDFKPEVTDVIENIISAPGEGLQFIQDEFSKGVEQGQDERPSALSVLGEVYRDTAPFVGDVLKGGGNLLLDQYNKLLNTPIEDYDYETEFFKNLFEGGGPESIPTYSGMQDGGRVGMQLGGGIMNTLLGSPQVQAAFQQYRQPTMDFSQVANPNIPQPAVAPETPPQAYTPFVSTMPLYDPSTLGTGLPSTAGMADPYFVYDPYSPVGAFDAPPASTGPTPAGGFLSQKQIDETFKDLDKFTLAKQVEKAEAEKAKEETKERGGGENRNRGRNTGGRFGGDRGVGQDAGTMGGTGGRRGGAGPN